MWETLEKYVSSHPQKWYTGISRKVANWKPMLQIWTERDPHVNCNTILLSIHTERESLTGVVWHLPCCSTGFQDLLTSHTLCMSFSYSTSKSGRRKTFQVNKLLGGQSHVLHLRGRTIQIICSWNASQMPVLTDTGLTSWLYGFGHITHSPDKQLPLQAAPWGCDSMACLPACYRKPVLQQEDEQSCGNLSP